MTLAFEHPAHPDQDAIDARNDAHIHDGPDVALRVVPLLAFEGRYVRVSELDLQIERKQLAWQIGQIHYGETLGIYTATYPANWSGVRVQERLVAALELALAQQQLQAAE